MSDEPIDPREERRKEWLDLLEGAALYHAKEARKTAPVLYMQPPSEEHIIHKAYTEAIREALELIKLLPTLGRDEGLPQHKVGPIG